MNERIKKLAEAVIQGKMWFNVNKTEFDRMDLLMPPLEKDAKRVYEYVLNQKPVITENNAFTGFIRFDNDGLDAKEKVGHVVNSGGGVSGDIFYRSGHKNYEEINAAFYGKPIDGLVTFEFQHSLGDFERVLKIGIAGIKKVIAESKTINAEPEKQEFLSALDKVCDSIIVWAEKCSIAALKKAKESEDPEVKNNMLKLGTALKKVPEYPAESFFEAILCIYLCYGFVPDSIGTIDRYLYSFYKRDIENGIMTDDEAKAYLQELFLMLQAKISIYSDRFYRGGESHFCVGGYLQDGSDGFTELSRLVVEALMELPTCIPQISLRWTKKTLREDLKFMMDCERNDTNKRIAFVNDEPRIKAFMQNTDLSYEEAIKYCMLGCNEPALPGGCIKGSSHQNILMSVANTFHNRSDELINVKTFDEFYKIYEEELFSDMTKMLEIDDAFNAVRSRDINIVSSIFFKGCIENAKSVSADGASLATGTLIFMGITNVIDSLAVTKQFVFDENLISMTELVDALKKDWVGYEDLRNHILKKGKFFGNDDETSNEVARRFTSSVYKFLQDKRNFMGKKILVGNLIGYNEHHKWFGAETPATPDGRYDGQPTQFGMGQSEGRDREGLTALLNSIAKCDPNCILEGPSVTNVLLDEQLVRNDENFEKLVTMFETYFKNGGTHFQLSYVSKEDLIAAKEEPDKYKSLRVRVSGFSDFFVNLNDALQDEIILRTVTTK